MRAQSDERTCGHDPLEASCPDCLADYFTRRYEPGSWRPCPVAGCRNMAQVGRSGLPGLCESCLRRDRGVPEPDPDDGERAEIAERLHEKWLGRLMP